MTGLCGIPSLYKSTTQLFNEQLIHKAQIETLERHHKIYSLLKITKRFESEKLLGINLAQSTSSRNNQMPEYLLLVSPRPIIDNPLTINTQTLKSANTDDIQTKNSLDPNQIVLMWLPLQHGYQRSFNYGLQNNYQELYEMPTFKMLNSEFRLARYVLETNGVYQPIEDTKQDNWSIMWSSTNVISNLPSGQHNQLFQDMYDG